MDYAVLNYWLVYRFRARAVKLIYGRVVFRMIKTKLKTVLTTEYTNPTKRDSEFRDFRVFRGLNLL